MIGSNYKIYFKNLFPYFLFWYNFSQFFKKIISWNTNKIETAKETLCIEQFFGLCGRGRGWDDLG